MASDSAFHYYLTQPTGLAIIAFALALSFIVWRLSLGKASVAPSGTRHLRPGSPPPPSALSGAGQTDLRIGCR